MKTTIPSSSDDDQQEKITVLACSGASDVGELTDKVARKLKIANAYNMKCLAMVSAGDKTLFDSLQKGRTLIIDGCDTDCGKRIMKEAWLSDYQYLRLTDMGFVKGKTPVTNETVDRICAMCISNVITFQLWEKMISEGGFDVEVNKFDMGFRGMSGMFKDEGVVNGTKVIYKYITNKKIRKRMKKLGRFFKLYPEYIGYGIYVGTK